MNPIAYYLGFFFSDLILFVIPCLLVMMVSLIMNITTFDGARISIFMDLVFFGLCFMSLNYLISHMFSKSETAFKYQVLALMLVFALKYIVQLVMGLVSNGATWTDEVAKGFLWVSPFDCLMELILDDLSNANAQQDNPDDVSPVLPHLGVPKGTLYLIFIVQTIILFSATVAIDYLRINSFKGQDNRNRTVERTQLPEYQDVIDHKNEVKEKWDSDDYLIKSRDLYKVYPGGVAAINKNTFGVKKGEVFGLLGPNGAGKSSMFNVMTMDLKRTSGDVRILNTDLDRINISQQGKLMGMVPQYNTIWEAMTVDESINFIGEIKGLPAEEIEFQKEFIKNTLDLDPFANTNAPDLSGGNKRKLVCAMSLVACP